MVDSDAISAALFDLDLEEIKALEALEVQSSEDVFLEYERQRGTNNGATTAEMVDAAFTAVGYSLDDQINDDEGSDLTDLRKICTGTIEEYIA